MSQLQALKDAIRENNPNALFFDGFDQALVGKTESALPLACYDLSLMKKVLMNNMSEEEAIEYLDYNVLNVFMGENTPLVLDLDNFVDKHRIIPLTSFF